MKEKLILQDFLRDEFFIKMVNNPNADTRHYWKLWLARYPERQEDFELAKQIVHSIKYKNPRKLSESDYDRLFTQIIKFKKLEDEKDSNNILPKKRKLFQFMAWAAAIILFLITFSFSVFYFIHEKKPVELSIHEVFIEKKVPLGAKKTIKLSDGSVIRLNSGSKLIFPKQFANDNRTVELRGEAFFDVSKDSNRPFIIKTGDVSTQVLGTSFNIRNYDFEDNIEVALVSGLVKINDSQGNETLLKPLEMAVYSKDAKNIKKNGFNIKLVTSWKDNIIVFEKASINQIMGKLERWYGVKIEIDFEKPIVGLYSGEFQNETLNVVLDGIGYASGFNYSIDNNFVTIKN